MGVHSCSGVPRRALTSLSQFYDLIEIFRIGGYAPSTNYLFLGEQYYHVFHIIDSYLPTACRRLRRPRLVQCRDHLPPYLPQITPP